MKIDFNDEEKMESAIDEMQNNNIAILFAALKKIDEKIDEIYPEADLPSRVATYLSAMDMAAALYLHGIKDASKEEIYRAQVAMYKTLIGANRAAYENRDRDTPREESMETAKKLAEEFSKNAG